MPRERNYLEAKEITAPAGNYAAITPHDSTDFTDGVCRGIYVGGAGNVAVVKPDGSAAVTFVGALAGTVIPVHAIRVNSTNTTATNLVALY